MKAIDLILFILGTPRRLIRSIVVGGFIICLLTDPLIIKNFFWEILSFPQAILYLFLFFIIYFIELYFGKKWRKWMSYPFFK